MSCPFLLAGLALHEEPPLPGRPESQGKEGAAARAHAGRVREKPRVWVHDDHGLRLSVRL